MNTHEHPDDLRHLEALYTSPEEHVKQLEEALLYQNKKLLELQEENKRLKGLLFGININQTYY